MAELSKPGVELKLHRIAGKINKSNADAKNLVEVALIRVLDREDRPCVPAECKFLTHMLRVMRRARAHGPRGQYTASGRRSRTNDVVTSRPCMSGASPSRPWQSIIAMARALGGLASRVDARALRGLVPALVALALAPFLAAEIRLELKEPLFTDQLVFQYTGWCIRHGLRLYRDVGMADGPFIHYLHATLQVFAGMSDRGFRIADSRPPGGRERMHGGPRRAVGPSEARGALGAPDRLGGARGDALAFLVFPLRLAGHDAARGLLWSLRLGGARAALRRRRRQRPPEGRDAHLRGRHADDEPGVRQTHRGDVPGGGPSLGAPAEFPIAARSTGADADVLRGVRGVRRRRRSPLAGVGEHRRLLPLVLAHPVRRQPVSLPQRLAQLPPQPLLGALRAIRRCSLSSAAWRPYPSACCRSGRSGSWSFPRSRSSARACRGAATTTRRCRRWPA